jgi:hypothetical protein
MTDASGAGKQRRLALVPRNAGGRRSQRPPPVYRRLNRPASRGPSPAERTIRDGHEVAQPAHVSFAQIAQTYALESAL